VICSITSSGFAMPPDQKASQFRSIFAFSSPVITASNGTGGADRGGQRTSGGPHTPMRNDARGRTACGAAPAWARFGG
jgi:hypothetical protein